MKGKVESMKVWIEFGSKEIVEPFAAVEVIDCRPTTRSREESGARLKVTLLGISLEISYPPNVKLPKKPFPSVKSQP